MRRFHARQLEQNEVLGLNQPAGEVAATVPFPDMERASARVDLLVDNVAENTRDFEQQERQAKSKADNKKKIDEAVMATIEGYSADTRLMKSFKVPPWDPVEAKRIAPFRAADMEIIRREIPLFAKCRRDLVLNFPYNASLLHKLQRECETLMNAETAKLKKDQNRFGKLVTAVQIEPKMAKDENWMQQNLIEDLDLAREQATRLVCSLPTEEQYLIADELWDMIPKLHPHRSKAEDDEAATSRAQQVFALQQHAATVTALANGDEIRPLNAGEKELFTFLESVGLEDLPTRKQLRSMTEAQQKRMLELRKQFDDDDVEAARKKQREKRERLERYQPAPPLKEEHTKSLRRLAKHLNSGAKKLEEVVATREALIMGSLEQHYMDVEDVLEEVGIGCLTLLESAADGSHEPWYEGREAAKKTLGACQRMSLNEIRLKNRIPQRPSAADEAAPVPPAWYLATPGEYFTGGLRRAAQQQS